MDKLQAKMDPNSSFQNSLEIRKENKYTDDKV